MKISTGRNGIRFKQGGQTVIETVLMLTILLVIFFVIAEFARAWYLKNSLNNAARVAVRKAVVDQNLGTLPAATYQDQSCPNPNEIVNAVCTAPGVPNISTTKVNVLLLTDVGPAGPSTGDIIEVNVRAVFNTIVPNLLTFMPTSAYSSASMRYE